MHCMHKAITPMNSSSTQSARRSGFTLVELLAVIAVIAVVIAFAVPAVNTVLRGSQLSQGSQILGDQLSYAHQLAVTKNRTIEVRFYRFGDPETPGENYQDPGTGYWRAFQLFEILENGVAVPSGSFQRLPRMVVLDGTKRSTLLDEAVMGTPKKGDVDKTAPDLPVEIGGKKVGKNYEYLAFRFQPDGTTNLPLKATKAAEGGGTAKESDAWYITVLNLSDITKEIKNINYAVIQIDPVTGSQKTFRPTVGK